MQLSSVCLVWAMWQILYVLYIQTCLYFLQVTIGLVTLSTT